MVKNYYWQITLKKIHKDSGIFVVNGVKKPFDSCSSLCVTVHAKDITEALKKTTIEMKKDYYNGYTICDVYNASFYPCQH